MKEESKKDGFPQDAENNANFEWASPKNRIFNQEKE